ncbi:MAG: type 1 glutamine amidotransferase [Pseudomonadota bacterium]
MLIGILNCGHFAKRPGAPKRDYDDIYAQFLDGHGFTFRAWHVVDMDFPDSVQDADGWLLGGSKYGVYEDIPFIEPLKAFVREAYAAGVPTVGICFGHQLIASALGGHVEKFSKGWAMGHADYDFEGEALVLNAFHQDQVITLPADARRLASNAFCENAALAYKGRAMSVQPHPEFTQEDMALLYEVRAPQLVASDHLAAVRRREGEANDNAAMARRIAAFYKGVA